MDAATNKDQNNINRLVNKLNVLLSKYDKKIEYDDTEKDHHDCLLGENYPDEKFLEELFEQVNNLDIKIVYEDNNGKPLDNFLPMSVMDLMSFIDENITAYNAVQMGVYEGDKRIGTLSLGDKAISESPKRLYRVGLLSDIHFNDKEVREDGNIDVDEILNDDAEWYIEAKNALKYYTGKTGEIDKVDFIAASGDISTDSIKSVRNFYLMLMMYAKHTPFFSCYGNHDFRAVTADSTWFPDGGYGLIDTDQNLSRTAHWNHMMFDQHTNKYEGIVSDIEHYKDDINDRGYATYCYRRYIDKEKDIYDVYIFLSVDYDNASSSASKRIEYNGKDINQKDINRLFDYVYERNYYPNKPQDRIRYENYYDLQYYDCGALMWLADKFEQYKNKRVFLFTHLFFPDGVGTNNSHKWFTYTNYTNNRISENSSYCLSGIQYEFMKILNNTYNKSIWFTGHSHYKWEWQKIDRHINISNTEFESILPGSQSWVLDHDLRYHRRVTSTQDYTGRWYEVYRNKDRGFYEIGSYLQGYFYPIPNTKYSVDVNASINCTDVSMYYDNPCKQDELVGELQMLIGDKVVNSHNLYLKLSPTNGPAYDYNFEFNTFEKVTFRLLINKQCANWISLRVNLPEKEIHKLVYDTNITNYQSKSYATNHELDQMPKVDNYEIVKTKNTAYNVHIPSTSRPICTYRSTFNYSIQGMDSQGGIMDVYKDFVDIRGICFKDIALKHDYATKTFEKVVDSVCYSPDGATISMPNSNLTFTFYKKGQSVHVDLSELETLITNGKADITHWQNNDVRKDVYVTLAINSIESAERGIVTSDITSYNNPPIGLVTKNEGYRTIRSLDSCSIHDFNRGCIVFECSNELSDYYTFPITVTLDINVQMMHMTNFLNKYIPIAQYRIPIAAN